MMKRSTILPCTAAALLLLSSCSKSKDDTPAATPATGNTIKVVQDAAFGSVLTDASGKTLYFFTIDADGNSGCSGNCTAAWPAFYTANPSAAGLNNTDFGTITRPDGQKQTTYKGWPLYYFAGDNSAGAITGDAVDQQWFVAKPDYTVMLANRQLVGEDGQNYNSNYQPGNEVTQYITDDRGRTLYVYAPDKLNKNTYTASDFSNDSVWPIDTTGTIMNVPSTLHQSDFGIISVFGRPQITYKGWPLYYFGADGGIRGRTKGVSVPQPGVWPIVNSNTLMATP